MIECIHLIALINEATCVQVGSITRSRHEGFLVYGEGAFEFLEVVFWVEDFEDVLD